LQAFKLNGLSEFDMGKTIVDSAAQAGVRHFIFSTGPDCLTLTGGKVKMNAADSKSLHTPTAVAALTSSSEV
jgi:hypothetical protein